MLMAPSQNFAAINIPSEIDDDIAFGNILPKKGTHVFAGDSVFDEGDAFFDPRAQGFIVGIKIHDGDILGWDFDMVH